MEPIPNRIDELQKLVDKHGLDAVHAASGYTSKRTIKQYLSQRKNPSWEIYHRLRNAFK